MPVNAIVALVVLLICIVIGFMTRINMGLISIVGAFIVGTIVMGMKPNTVLNLWDSSLFVTLFTITMFFGISVSNGTLRKISLYFIYPFRNNPKVLPFVLFAVAFIIAAIGPGSIATVAMLAPIYMAICKEMKMNYIMVPIMVGSINGGAWSPIALNGQMCRANLINAGFAPEVVGDITNKMGVSMFFTGIITLVIGYFVMGAYKAEKVNFEKPDGFDEDQKKTLVLLGIMLFFVGMIPVFGTFVKTTWFSVFKGWIHIYMMCAILSVVAIFMKITDSKKLLSNVRWDTIILLGGVSILIKLANQAGMVEYLTGQLAKMSSSAMNNSVAGVSGVLSFFTSTLVVMPTVMPIINGLAAAGANATVLNCAMITAATGAGFSPLSLIGSLVMAGLDKSADDSVQRKLFGQLWILAIFSTLLALFLTSINAWGIISKI